jgi:carbon starvation protein CstA
MAKIIGSYSGFIKTLVIDIRTHRKYPAKSETDFLNYLETECRKADDELKHKWNKLFN